MIYKIKIKQSGEIFYCKKFTHTKTGFKFEGVIKLTKSNGLPISYIEFKGKSYIANRFKIKQGTITISDIDISVIEIDGTELDMYLFETQVKKHWWKL